MRLQRGAWAGAGSQQLAAWGSRSNSWGGEPDPAEEGLGPREIPNPGTLSVLCAEHELTLPEEVTFMF